MRMLAFILTLFLIVQQKEDVYIIDISSPRYKTIRVQLVPKDNVSEELSRIVSRNLSIIGYFDVVKDEAEILVDITRTPEGFQFSAYLSEEDFFRVEMKGNNIKTIAYAFSNYVIHKVTGIRADIFGKKLFVLSNLDGRKEIYQMDFISDKLEKIVSAKSFISSFSVSPSGNKIAYTHYDGKNYKLYIADLKNQNIYSPILKDGMFVSANFISDSMLLVGWNSGSGANIYSFDILKKTLSKLTTSNADISAKMMPDGERMIVVSGRDGLPQIYVRRINGTEEKLPLSGRYNSSPDISPDGKNLVFAKLEGSRLNLYTYNFETKTERPLITDFGSSENPFWTRDGNFVLFSSNRDGDYDIYITDKFGSFIKKVFDTPKDEFQAILR